jgi:hypothetical protein
LRDLRDEVGPVSRPAAPEAERGEWTRRLIFVAVLVVAGVVFRHEPPGATRMAIGVVVFTVAAVAAWAAALIHRRRDAS